MFHNGDGYTVQAECCCECRATNVVGICFNPVFSFQVPANEDDALIDVGRSDDHADLPSGMQPDASATYFPLNRSLKKHTHP